MGDSFPAPHTKTPLVNMNALIVIGLCALSANAQFLSGVLPYSTYTPNFLHSGAFTSAIGSPITYAASPLAYTTAAVAPAVVAPTTRTSQFHSQDELGQYNLGYAGGPSSRHEVRDAFGNVRGSYNYVDANGEVQTNSYVSDALGFRVAATNLPVAPKAADAPALVGPEPVMETAEVASARAAHEKAHAEAAAAAAAAPDTSVRRKRSVGSVAIHSAVSPLRFSYGFNNIHPYNFPFTTYAAAGHAVAPAAVAPAAVAPVSPLTYTTGLPLTLSAGHAVAPAAIAPAPAVTTYTAGAAIAPAVTYTAGAAPAVAATHDAELLRVENNPGHAVSYRVY